MSSNKFINRKKNNPYNNSSPLYKTLTRLLSGPINNWGKENFVIGRKRDLEKYNFKSASGQSFKRSSVYNPFKEIQAGAMANRSRAERYLDFDAMEFTPEIASALDIYADEITTYTQFSPLLKIESPNAEIAEILQYLFYDVLNIQLNCHTWVRTVCKYGDLFLYLDIDEQLGITNAMGLPPSEIERLEGEDETNPNYVQFQWNAGGITFENWQLAHFRILGNDKFVPYGSSVLEGSRRIWKALNLLEDAVMSYRIVRCLPYNSRILTKDGYKYIGEIKPGELIYSFNKNLNKLELSPVTDWINNGLQKIYKIKSLHRTLEANSNHPILVKNKKTNIVEYVNVENLIPKIHQIYIPKLENFAEEPKKIELNKEKYEWYGFLTEKGKQHFLNQKYDFSIRAKCREIENKFNITKFRISQFLYGKNKIKGLPIEIAKEVIKEFSLEEEYLITYPKAFFNLDRNQNIPEYVDKEFARFFGFMIGDGYMTKNKHSIGFATGIYQEINDYYASILKKYDSSCTFHHDKRTSNPILGKYKVSSQYLANLFEDMGFTSSVYTKKIPDWIFKCSREIKEAFIDGLIDADGSIKKNRTSEAYQITLCNKNLIEGLKELIHHLGWNVTSEIKKRISTRKNNKIGNAKLKKTEFISYYLYFTKVISNEFENILSVEDTERYENVFDIRVENENHNFIANGVIVHNSPERRVFKIDVGSIDPKEVPAYIEQIRTEIKRNAITDPTTGRVDLRYNPMSIEEDYFIPVRKGDSSNIETLSGGQYTGDIDDIKYFRDKLFTSLKIPASYLSQGDGMEEKASLAQKDIMFARTILRIQNSVISEFKKIAIIHLWCLGYKGNDLLNFDLSFHNPSRIAELQELEYMRTKFSVGVEAKDLFSQSWIDKNIFKLSDSEIIRNRLEKFTDVKTELALQSFLESFGDDGAGGGPPDMALGGGPGGSIPGLEGGGPGAGEGEESPLAVTPTDDDMRALQGKPRLKDLSKVQDDAKRQNKPTEKSLEDQSKGHIYTRTKPNHDGRRHQGPRKRSIKNAGANFVSNLSMDDLFAGMNTGMSNLTRKMFENVEEENEEEILLSETVDYVKIISNENKQLIKNKLSKLNKINRIKNR